jgi:uroporphyrinogen-III synthase
MRLLVTRPEPAASALAAELAALGHEPVLQPLLEFRCLDFDPAPLKGANALIFTSANGVRALAQKIDIGTLKAPTAFCVGQETARCARLAGFPHVVDAAGTAKELGSMIVSRAEKEAKLVHVTGEHQAFDFSQALAHNGRYISTLCVYGMTARGALDPGLADNLKAGGIGGVLLMSPRTAEIFVSLCRLQDLLDCAKALHYYCLSSSVAEKLIPLDPTHVHTAAGPNLPALLALLSPLPTPGHDPVRHVP